MSLTFFFTVLSITCIVRAERATHVEPACQTLKKINETHLLDPVEFKTALQNCSDAKNKGNMTLEAASLLEVYGAINIDQQCSFDGTSEVEGKLIDCVKETGLAFTVEVAKSHFALDDTLSLQFRTNECKRAAKMSDCVENLFSTLKLDRKLKACKDNLFRGFQVTSKVCRSALLRDDRNNSHTYLPYNSLFFGTTFLLVKYVISSGF